MAVRTPGKAHCPSSPRSRSDKNVTDAKLASRFAARYLAKHRRFYMGSLRTMRLSRLVPIARDDFYKAVSFISKSIQDSKKSVNKILGKYRDTGRCQRRETEQNMKRAVIMSVAGNRYILQNGI